jgi:hypothetical protein
MRVIIFLFLFAFKSLTTQASFEFTTTCIEAYECAVDFKFEKAKAILLKEKKNNPENFIPHLIENEIDFLTLFIGEEQAQFDLLKGNKEKRMALLEREQKDSPYFLYCQAELNLQWAFARLKFGEYLTASYEVYRAYFQLKDNLQKYPGFIPARKSLGLLYCLLGTIPDEYKKATKLIGLEGDIGKGLEELKAVIEQVETKKEFGFLKTETLFFIGFMQMNLLNEANSPQPKINKSKHLLLDFSTASMAMKSAQNDLAIEILSNRPQGEEYFPIHYLDYLMGIAKLNRLDPDADLYFEKFIKNFKGQNYIKSAYQKLAWCSLIKGDTIGYKKCIEKAKDYKIANVDEDKQAEAEIAEFPNVKLLKARLLFDGGYYQKALALLIERSSKDDYSGVRNELEFRYRLSRIKHKMNDTDAAIEYYKLTLKSGEKQPYYFAASAALQLGLIFEQRKDKQLAEFYFEKCIALKNHQYRNSLSQKAKAGINRLHASGDN